MDVLFLRIVKDVIEFFYNKLDFASNSYMHFEQELVRDIEKLFDNLAEHEKRRVREIKRSIRSLFKPYNHNR